MSVHPDMCHMFRLPHCTREQQQQQQQQKQQQQQQQ
jgi:hypothetical protein